MVEKVDTSGLSPDAERCEGSSPSGPICRYCGRSDFKSNHSKGSHEGHCKNRDVPRVPRESTVYKQEMMINEYICKYCGEVVIGKLFPFPWPTYET